MSISTRVLFTSWHFYLDSSNGASISARELLRALVGRGWDVKTFCGSLVDNPNISDVGKVLTSHGIKATQVVDRLKTSPYAIETFNDSGIRSLVYCPQDSSAIPSKLTGERFLEYLKVVLEEFQPDYVMTYGGYWMAPRTLEIIRRSGAKSVFLLQNFAYKEKEFFDSVDLTLVLSKFCADAYRERVGIESTPLPPLMRREDVVPIKEEFETAKKYVLFVNPSL